MFWSETAHVTGTRPPIKPAQTTEQQYFQSGNPNTGTKATILGDEWLNMVTDELLAIVQDAKITPDKMNNAQVLEAIKKLIANHVDASLGDIIDQIMNQVDDAINQATGNIVNNSLIYPSAFHSFYEKTPPEGWMVRNGALIPNASKTVPELWEALSKSANAWKLKTESQWQQMSAADSWKGIGGVPFFVLDKNAKTIRLPDTRGMYLEDAGFDGLVVGGVHEDMTRRLLGSITATGNDEPLFGTDDDLVSEGALYGDMYGNWPNGAMGNGSGGAWRKLVVDSLKTLPTGNANKPRAFGVLGCVYVGKSAS